MNLMARKTWLVGIVALTLLAQPALAASKRKLRKRMARAAKFFEDVMKEEDRAIPSSLIRKCSGIIILRQYKAGFVFGVKGGRGIVLAKDDATQRWSPPVFISTVEGSYGLQIGGQSVQSIFLVMNTETLKKLLKGRFKVGVDASAAAGPVGRDNEAKIGHGAAMLTYSWAKGLFAGVAFEGGILVTDNDADEAFYGVEGISARDILFKNKVKMPKAAKRLIRLLTDAARRSK